MRAGPGSISMAGAMSDYAGRNVLITGAASGIGRLLAQKIAAEGARVILWDVESAALERTRAELAAAGRTVATKA